MPSNQNISEKPNLEHISQQYKEWDASMNELTQIQDWYFSQCDGDWEHQYGLKIETLDNPGWSLEIDLAETELEQKPFKLVEKGTGVESVENDPDWYSCKIEDKKFICHCGPHHLGTVFQIFLRWKNG